MNKRLITALLVCTTCTTLASRDRGNMTNRVFSVGSIWNVPLSNRWYSVTEPKFNSIGAQAVELSTWTKWSVTEFYASPTDPMQQILYAYTWPHLSDGSWKSFGNSAAVEKTILAASTPSFPIPSNVYSSQSASSWILPNYYDKLINPPTPIHLPASAVPVTGSDSPMVVFQPDGTVFEAYAAIRLSTGQVVAMNYHITDGRGEGSGYASGTCASMVPVYAGIIRNSEFVEGSIEHAMKILAPAAVLKEEAVYPALTFDRNAETFSHYSGNLPMGSQLAIPTSVDLTKLGLTTTPGKIIATAAQKYGFIITDQGGSGISVIVDGGATFAGVGNYEWGVNADLMQIMKVVQTVR